jgi:UDP-glucuronate decarboxylase
MQALTGRDITVYGSGKQTRSFCYVDDMVDALIRMMNSPQGLTGPVNVGNPGEYTILELAEKIIDLTGSKSSIVFKPLPQDDPLQRRPDITLAERHLGWRPSTDLSDGLQRTVDYFKEFIAKENG